MAPVVTESVDPERLALSWAIVHQDLVPLIVSGLTPEDFEDDEHAGIYEWMLGHYRQHNRSPGRDALSLHDPNYRLTTPTDHIDVYLADIQEGKRYNRAASAVQVASNLIKDSRTDDAIVEMTRAVADLNALSSTVTDEDITGETSTRERYAYYDTLRSNPGALRGYRTGFHTIDRATMGVQRQQFIVLGGFQKSGKSTALLVMCKEFNKQGAKSLVVSFEMSGMEQKARWDAIWSRVNYRKIMTGDMSVFDMQKLRRAHRDMENGFPCILATDTARTTTVAGIAAKVEKHRPDIVLVDGLYLMMDEYEAPGSPQALTNITRDFKRLCQQADIPIIGTTQASERRTTRARGVTTSSFSWSQSFGQDADVLIGMQPPDDETHTPGEMRVLESRHGPRVRAQLIWDWETTTFEERFGGDDDAPEDSTDEDNAQF